MHPSYGLCLNVYECFVKLYNVTFVTNVLFCFEIIFEFSLFVFCVMTNFVKLKS